MNYYTLIEPELTEIAEFIKKYWRSHVVVLFLNCEVRYRGRAESFLEYGDRILMTKPDGTLLIHDQSKREPINWQPPGSTIAVRVKDKMLVIRSIRPHPREEIIISSPIIYVATAFKCTKGKFVLWGSESEMVDFLIRHPEIFERDIKFIGREVQTPYGKIDLIGEDSERRFVIFEFKRSIAQLQGVSQLKRYVDYYTRFGKDTRGVLVAPSITSSALRLLKEYGLEYLKLQPVKFTITVHKVKE